MNEEDIKDNDELEVEVEETVSCKNCFREQRGEGYGDSFRT